MSGLIVKEYKVYCKNYKECHQWAILTTNTSRKEAEEVALKRGWEKGPDGICTGEQDLRWICPKCLKKMKHGNQQGNLLKRL